MFDSFGDFWQWGDGIFRDIAIALLIILVFGVVAAVLRRKVGPAICKRVDEKKHPILSQLLLGFNRPVAAFLRFIGIMVALLFLCRSLPSERLPAPLLSFLASAPPILHKAVRISIVVTVAWGLISSSQVAGLILRNARHRLDLHMSKSVSRFLAAVFNVVVVAIATVVILSELNYDINGLIAGLGLGGLTIALAAKDSAENFFGGLVLIMEKPFEIGDWIATPDVEGTVEDISLRSTKVRNSAGSLTVVPNAKLSSSPITNWSGAMKKRRADFTLGFEYGSSREQLKGFVAAAQTLLESDPEILTESITVRFSDISASSLDIRVIFYTALPGFSDFIRIKERINYALMDLAKTQQLTFAFPAQSVYLHTEEAPKA